MKKLLIAMGCISAIILMSSCTTDSLESDKKENSNNYNKISVSATDEIASPPPPLIDDRDKTKG
ncbi:hypothetical protein [Flavobacterium sp. GT3P67]|uniref:hypothetical protein n=1 Tax=Flavobacterium sp. GT3P67 TaxID=2541722 RepID=UPI00104D1816|nr:hypothetical protein [Flavobacterium sp. GT3P67]TDE52710.1 hypothetical protein E0H99_11345 [Flavobacterium sp. GT3P67]